MNVYGQPTLLLVAKHIGSSYQILCLCTSLDGRIMLNVKERRS